MTKITQFLKQSSLLFFLLASVAVFGQSVAVKGTVKDAQGLPVPGASVTAGTVGTATDVDGNFSLSLQNGQSYTVSVSFVGYKTASQAITATSKTELSFVLEEESTTLEDVVVTGVVNPRSKIKSSVSITSIDAKQVEQAAPRTTAEIFRTIPGIRSESSGGEGNANIAVRGVPISSGGSKYLQLQEDGLPVLMYGDIAFATADIFTRFDANIGRIEAIRGGSASTLASNSPGGIINFISKTGKTEGGSMTTSFGMDYDNFRTDIEYGGKIADGLYFHAGGFYRTGEGVRSPNFNANNGGQFKFNITKEFERGSVTVYTKFLNDRAAAYMPMPIQVSGTNANPNWSDAPNYDATTGALQSIYLKHNVSLDRNGNIQRRDVADGMNPVSKSIGVNATFEVGDGWKITENGRFSKNSGGFIAPFPAQVASGADIAATFGAGSTLAYADNNQAVSASQLVSRIHMFDTQLNNFDNFMNDLRISKKIEGTGLSLTAGYFKSIQNISMSWTWNSYLMEVNDNNARLINVVDAGGNALSENGLYAYGTPFWDNLARNYDTQYNVSAPYMNVSFDVTEKLNLEGGVRYDKGVVTGNFAGGTSTQRDMNNDGVISAPEQNVFAIDTANPTTVNYDYDYVSFTLGGNYLLTDKQSVFARYSRGGSAKADRILFSGLNYLNGDAINAKDMLDQAEIGYKQKFSNGYVFGTLFYSKTTEEGGFEATSNTIIENDYRSMGLEIEAGYNPTEKLNLRFNGTYTKAEVVSGDNDGNDPRRQPRFMYSVLPTFNFSDKKSDIIGLSFIGQTKAYAQDDNKLVMDGFLIVNGFVEFGLTKGLSLNLAANNIFDTLAITEAEEGSITENTTNIVRARPLPGRSVSAAVTYRF